MIVLKWVLPFLLQAAAPDKPKEPEYMTKHKKVADHIDPALATATHHHKMAFGYAEKKVLMDEKGDIQYKFLDEGKKLKDGKKFSAEEVQKQFRKEIGDYYEKNILNSPKWKKVVDKLDPADKPAFIKAITNYDDNLMKRIHEDYGGGANWTVYDQRVEPAFQQEKRKALEDKSTEHVTEEDLVDILKQAKVETHHKLTLTQGQDLLAALTRGKGHVSVQSAREVLGKNYKKHKTK